MASLGSRLSILRVNMGLTQQEVGDRVGLTKAAIYMYEADKNQPPVEVILKLATLFNVTSDYIIDGREKRVLNIEAPSDEQKKIIAEIDQLIIKLFRSGGGKR